MIYIIDNCYADNHREECIIVKNKNLTMEEMTDIVGALGNLYAKSKNITSCQPQKLWNVLCTNFGCKDRKHKYLGELEFVESRIQSPMLHATFLLYDEFIVWLDIKEAMRYTIERMYSILDEHMEQDEIQVLKESWGK